MFESPRHLVETMDLVDHRLDRKRLDRLVHPLEGAAVADRYALHGNPVLQDGMIGKLSFMPPRWPMTDSRPSAPMH